MGELDVLHDIVESATRHMDEQSIPQEEAKGQVSTFDSQFGGSHLEITRCGRTGE